MSKAFIKSVTTRDFKGSLAEQTINFGPVVTNIMGPNRAGKTTIADAILWALTGKDSSLTTNPTLTNNNKPTGECQPYVEILMDINGKEVTVVRSQKNSVRERNGKTTTTTVNTYSINGVAMPEKQAVTKFAEYGIDMNLMLMLMHPAVFTGMATGDTASKATKDTARGILFNMTGTLTDAEIAKRAGTNELLARLENFTIAEIAAQVKGVKRKVAEEYGKDGSILQAKIQGVERTIVEIDDNALLTQKQRLEEDLTDAQMQLDGLNAKKDRVNALAVENSEFIVKQVEVEKRINAEFTEKRNDLTEEIISLSDIKRAHESMVDRLDSSIASDRREMDYAFREKSRAADALEKAKAMTLDESSLVCPTCGRPYEADKADEIRRAFEERKNGDITRYSDKVNSFNAEVNALKKSITEKETQRDEQKAKAEATDLRIKVLRAEKDALKAPVPETDPEYAVLAEKIASLKNESNAIYAEYVRKIPEAEDRVSHIKQSISNVCKAIAASDANKERNERAREVIAKYREQRMEYEQALADAQMIEDEIAEFGKMKNEMLTEAINEHFRLVTWELFDYQKNGEYKEVIVPMIGKTPFENLSGGEKLQATIDIAASLQRYYKTYLPIIADEMGIATKDTVDVVKALAGTQLVMLTAEDTEGGGIIVESI